LSTAAVTVQQTDRVVLRAEGITKLYPGVRALDQVSLDLRAGEVHAVVGENGAGKSTLMTILAGAQQPDGGSLIMDGRHVQVLDRRAAEQLGISIVFQELSLVTNLSIADNVFAARQPIGILNLVRQRELYARTQVVLDRFNLGLNARTLVGTLPTASRQVVEIAKALSLKARVLILDEPTSSLTQNEAQKLFEIIRQLRDEGLAIFYISHHLDEVFSIADRISVLRDGKHVGTCVTSETTESEIVHMMVGREVQVLYGRSETSFQSTVGRDPILEASGLQFGSQLRDVSIRLVPGEIVGVAGLVGAGRTELGRALYGLLPLEGGHIAIDGKPVQLRSPADAISHGIAYIPQERKEEGLFLLMHIVENISAPNLSSLSRGGMMLSGAANRLAADYAKALNIRAPSLYARVSNLSGGNQQKVLVSMWLARKPRLLIVDEPTRGIDIGAKAEIHRLLQSLAGDGLAILMISSELPEILTLSHRVLVMAKGCITGEFAGADVDEEQIMACASGLAVHLPTLSEPMQRSMS
jgi:ABC-type sugar transport system ATPase subunit